MSGEPIVFYDMTPLLALKLEDDAQRWRFWDESQLVFALQGIVNRSQPRLFVRFIADADDFWWEQMTRAEGWLAGRKVENVTSVDDLLNRFRAEYRGVVVWDPRVPATSNLASTIAGCDDVLPMRYDIREGSSVSAVGCQRTAVGCANAFVERGWHAAVHGARSGGGNNA